MCRPWRPSNTTSFCGHRKMFFRAAPSIHAVRIIPGQQGRLGTAQALTICILQAEPRSTLYGPRPPNCTNAAAPAKRRKANHHQGTTRRPSFCPRPLYFCIPQPNLLLFFQILTPSSLTDSNRRSRPAWDGQRVHSHSSGQGMSPLRRRGVGDSEDSMEGGRSRRPDEPDIRVMFVLTCLHRGRACVCACVRDACVRRAAWQPSHERPSLERVQGHSRDRWARSPHRTLRAAILRAHSL